MDLQATLIFVWQRFMIILSAYDRNGESRASIPPEMASTQAWGYPRGPITDEEAPFEGPLLFWNCDRFSVLSVKKYHVKADGFALWFVGVGLVAHVGTLNDQV
jgi:hypothetical protein